MVTDDFLECLCPINSRYETLAALQHKFIVVLFKLVSHARISGDANSRFVVCMYTTVDVV